MGEIITYIGLSFVGVFVAQYAMGLLLRIFKSYYPFLDELAKITHIDPKVKAKLKMDIAMLIGTMLFAPLAVMIFASYQALIPYFIGFVFGSFLLKGKIALNEDNKRLFFYQYRRYFENDLILHKDEYYRPLLQYRRLSLIEKALKAEEEKLN